MKAKWREFSGGFERTAKTGDDGRFSIGGLPDFAVTLTASAGTFTAGNAGGVTVGGSTTGTLTLSGTATDINTYLDASWDFVDEIDNGLEDIWWMPEDDYPRLWWETRINN